MRKLIVSMQMTLDGYVASTDGKADWLISNQGDWDAMFEDLATVDTILVGRKMFPEYARYWKSALDNPKAGANERRYAAYAIATPHIMFSTTQKEIDWPDSYVAADIDGEITKIKSQEGKDIVAWGGATFSSALIRKRLADELRIVLNPRLMGDGLTLFTSVKDGHKLQLISERPLGDGLLLLKYQLDNHH